jgi:hypothetical protein
MSYLSDMIARLQSVGASARGPGVGILDFGNVIMGPVFDNVDADPWVPVWEKTKTSSYLANMIPAMHPSYFMRVHLELLGEYEATPTYGAFVEAHPWMSKSALGQRVDPLWQMEYQKYFGATDRDHPLYDWTTDVLKGIAVGWGVVGLAAAAGFALGHWGLRFGVVMSKVIAGVTASAVASYGYSRIEDQEGAFAIGLTIGGAAAAIAGIYGTGQALWKGAKKLIPEPSGELYWIINGTCYGGSV